MQDKKLATTFDELNEKFKHFQTDEGKAIADAFVALPSDIFISPFAKSGTTWTQQITHSLRTRGDMDFVEIMEVVPWLNMAYDTGIDIHAPQKAEPRLFKSHRTWDKIPKGARYIYTIRDPKDVIVSDYNFLGNWIFDTSSISLEVYVQDQYLKENYYWEHVSSWWSQFDNPDVLFLCYEDMKADLDSAIYLIAEFMGIVLDNELFEIVRRNASFEFMKAHNSHFDDHLIRKYRNAPMGLPPAATTSKVKSGKVGGHKAHLSAELIATIDSRWQTHMPSEYGISSYADIRDKIHARNIK